MSFPPAALTRSQCSPMGRSREAVAPLSLFLNDRGVPTTDRGTTITQVAPCGEIPPSADYTFQGDGSIVTPGFIDAHAHWSGTRRYYVCSLASLAKTPPFSRTHTLFFPWLRKQRRVSLLAPPLFSTPHPLPTTESTA